MNLILQHNVNDKVGRFHLYVFDSIIFLYDRINNSQA